MYHITLINLAPNAGSADAEAPRIDRRGVHADEMRNLLEKFCAIDPVENANVEPEIRVQVRRESYLLRVGQKKLILYDVLNREAPGHILSVDEVMAELDGSASAARSMPPWRDLSAGLAASEPAEPGLAHHQAPINVPRRIGLAALAGALLIAVGYVRLSSPAVALAGAYVPLAAADAHATGRTLAGVYLTGTEAGQHGIVVSATRELRLFEMRGLEPPRVVNGSFEPVRLGPSLALATDQPGGLILVRDPDTLLYCGETYARVR
ncbi:MAG: hypothetical protein Q7S40_14485 [Opitutaceae bacterium]|nr:hypothetical protein [Opitutaceae bacterium]